MITKRFIAGAVCPACQLVDKLVVYQLDEVQYCECVRCGYQQQQLFNTTANEASQVQPPLKAEPKAKVIKLIKKPKPKES